MRKIEKEMNAAINQISWGNAVNWAKDNTVVFIQQSTGKIFVTLHGSIIAHGMGLGCMVADKDTLLAYPTNTTMSRLRALGIDVCRRKGEVILNGEQIS